MLPEISYIKELVRVLMDNKLECISVDNIRIEKSKFNEVRSQPKSNGEINTLDPSEDEIMNWSLEEPVPTRTALQNALSSEPKRERKVRRAVV